MVRTSTWSILNCDHAMNAHQKGFFVIDKFLSTVDGCLFYSQADKHRLAFYLSNVIYIKQYSFTVTTLSKMLSTSNKISFSLTNKKRCYLHQNTVWENIYKFLL